MILATTINRMKRIFRRLDRCRLRLGCRHSRMAWHHRTRIMGRRVLRNSPALAMRGTHRRTGHRQRPERRSEHYQQQRSCDPTRSPHFEKHSSCSRLAASALAVPFPCACTRRAPSKHNSETQFDSSRRSSRDCSVGRRGFYRSPSPAVRTALRAWNRSVGCARQSQVAQSRV